MPSLANILAMDLIALYPNEPFSAWLAVDKALYFVLISEGEFPIPTAAAAHQVDPELVWEALAQLIINAEGPHERLSRTFR